LLAAAVVPGLAGISGAVYTDPVAFSAGFRTALMISAGLLVVAAAVAFALLGRPRHERCRCRRCRSRTGRGELGRVLAHQHVSRERFRLQQCVQQRRAEHDREEAPMVEALENIHVMDGDPVAPEHIPTALTAGGGASSTAMPPARSSNPLVPLRTSSTGGRHKVSGISTTTATSARSGPRVIEPATTSAGSLRKAESSVSDSANSARDHASTVITGDPVPPRLRADHACARPWRGLGRARGPRTHPHCPLSCPLSVTPHRDDGVRRSRRINRPRAWRPRQAARSPPERPSWAEQCRGVQRSRVVVVERHRPGAQLGSDRTHGESGRAVLVYHRDGRILHLGAAGPRA
jgi:hypothetical protein